MKQYLLFFFVSLPFFALAQEQSANLVTKRFAVTDTIRVDTVSINPSQFIIKFKTGQRIDSSTYNIDFAKALLSFKHPIDTDSIEITYLKYPRFITKVYKQLDDNVIVEQSGNSQLFKLSDKPKQNLFTPFDGLTTSGSISRGVTIGNNQNSVLNSELDLQISGKLSDKVSLRASIQDANIPLQESGYSQRLDEFDQVFIELLSDQWNVRAGDIDLANTNSYFANFTKRVQGLLVNANITNKFSTYASGALVRGQFTTTQITAQEGNQGPYKIIGENGELFVLIVSGSETVYVNGLPLQRGENRDYIIDYNAGEIIFNATFPITSEMRITVDYQFSDRNYSRFTVFGGGSYKSDKLNINLSVFSESDAKNQPLQQNLSAEQTQILADAGDNRRLMVAPSASEEAFTENRILYRRDIEDGQEIFVFSNNPDDTLFNVRFTLVGENQGNYQIKTEFEGDNTFRPVTTVYEYIAPDNNGIPQGNYAPIVQLTAPERLQIATLNGTYKPSNKTDIFFEVAGSKKDLNLFSGIDDDDNDGFAGKMRVKQEIIQSDSLWNVSALIDTDFIQRNFRTIERLYRAEFNRDWNLDNSNINQGNVSFGNQLLFNTGVNISHAKKGTASYNFEHLNFEDNFNGNRHNINANLQLGDFNIFSTSSFLNNEDTVNQSRFLRSFNRVVYTKKKKWAGIKFGLEDNQQNNKASDSLTALSQRFLAYEAFVGIGDSTKVFAEIGYIKRFNDSLRGNTLLRVSNSNTYYLKSRFIQNKNTSLQLFINYRDLKAQVNDTKDEQSLNSRLNYNQKLFKNLIFLNTNFETNSGTLPQQDFTYVEVEPGQGTYTWNDYNGNNIQELDEFELAQFQDEGNFIRVLLPNQIFIQTHQNRFSQTLTFNPKQWRDSKNKTKRFFSHFYNQASYLIDRRLRRNGNGFNLNPFAPNTENELGLNNSIRNVLFFNRGKQNYTTSYTFLSNTNRSLLSIGSQENTLTSHQLNFNHKFGNNWLLNTLATLGTDESFSENFSNRNYNINDFQFQPKLSYLFNDNAQFDVFYQYTTRENTILNLETLTQSNYGVSFTYNNAQKIALTGAFNYFKNNFTGSANTPVAYQMLQGLQPGNNFTWSLIAQKKLTKFLDLNLNYFGRKSESSQVIHTGNVQLRAYF